MLYRKLPKTGDKLSILGFGCMRLPREKGRRGNGKIDVKRATGQIRFAIDQGVNYLDTAMYYHKGESEPFLGIALSDGYRERVKLCTKLTHHFINTEKDMDNFFQVQLNNLKTEYIDYYLLHTLERVSWEKLKSLHVLEFLDRIKKSGRIKNAGFSFHGDKDTFKEIIDAYDWEFCQIQYNFLDEENQAGTEGLKYAAERDIGVIVMEPLRGGNLARWVPEKVQDIWEEADVKRTPAEWALRWVWNHPEVVCVLSGMNEEAHIEENIRIAGEAYANSLTQKELELVGKVRDTYRSLLKVGCTGCGYCMPCPSGVNIPYCFETYNNAYMFGQRQRAKMVYTIFLRGSPDGMSGYASQCTKCGKCEQVCPQHLPISKLLEDVTGEFEGQLMKPILWIVKVFLKIQRWRYLRRARRLPRGSV
jgi:uncharacterized protein